MPDVEKLSPMLVQYYDIKEKYKDYILFFRLGDFYEMFGEDAKLAARELELALTARAGTPMCGVPHHSSEGYVKRLIDKGFKVAICEQTTDPALSKGLVERDVVRLVTAGTVIEASMLDEGKNNYIACVYAVKQACAMVFADISTGEMHVFEKSGKNLEKSIISELSRFTPVELLFNSDFLDLKNVHDYIKAQHVKCTGELIDDEQFSSADISVLVEQFGEERLADCGISAGETTTSALCAIVRYFGETQKAAVKRFVKLNVHQNDEFMDLSVSTRRNLELCETMRNKERRGSLLWVLDKTSTSMGKRRLKTWIEQPLTNPVTITKRLDSVEELVKNPTTLFELCDSLHGIYDLERLMSRIVYKAASPRDIFALGKTCGAIPTVKAQLAGLSSPLFKQLDNNVCELSDIAALVQNSISDEPPNSIKDGNVIKKGFNDELDRFRKIAKGGREVLGEIEERERTETGIRTLKVGYNRVFGYYIEISKGNAVLAPAHYVRKQTLANCERFVTDELKKIESEILTANDKALALEEEIFGEIRAFISAKLEQIQTTAEALAEVDVLCSLANAAIENGYAKPVMTLDSVIEIRDGRHPVIEKMLTDKPFTPNDVLLDKGENRLIIITGPNMSGKSTYMRQTALIVLMAQIGSFVPASYARIGVVDKIFTRVGASDDLTAGQSTFMVEMNEVAEIIENATAKSLVILDEIGRGTSTFDGISIARAVAEHVVSKSIGCKTLFATHYHELISMESELKGVRNFSVAVSKKGDDIRFLHKIVEGGVDDSYGIEVAKLAGLPPRVIDRAKALLADMEKSSKKQLEKTLKESDENKEQIDFTGISEQNVLNKIKNTDINKLTPLKAFELFKEFKMLI